MKTQQAERAAQIDAADALALSDGDGDLEARLTAAGVTPGQVSADAVLARYQKTEVVQHPREQLEAPQGEGSPLPAAHERAKV